MLGASDAWSMSRTSKPVYYIEDCWISWVVGTLPHSHTNKRTNFQTNRSLCPMARANMAGLVLCKLAGDRVIAPAHNGLNAYLLSCNIVKYLCPLAIGGKGLLADKTAYLTDNITEKSIGEHPKPSIALYINFLKPIKNPILIPKLL